nr:polyprenol phosphomannose-dependent alpha 1,6 mannosyltransferase MptB [Pseudonocardia sp. AL041005-10]
MVTPEVAPPGRDDPPTRAAPSDPPATPPSTGHRARRGLREQARIARILGLTGALLMGISALGSGAFPVPNPLNGLRVIGLPSRNVTLAIAVTYAGLLMVVTAWLWIARMLTTRGAHHPAPERRELGRTAILWGVPLALAPPMFSKDIYSYLAQSATLARGSTRTRSVRRRRSASTTRWSADPDGLARHPRALRPAVPRPRPRDHRAVRENVVLGILEHRLLALLGVALMVWVLPRLASRFDLDAGLVLWLGAANPLVLFHMVSGIHNESIMLPLLLLGLWVMLGRDDTVQPWWRITGGAALVVAAASVKLPALLALGFVGVYLVRRRGGRLLDWAVMTAWLSAIAAAVLTFFSLATGLGFNWVRGLSAPSVLISPMSISTNLGLLAGQVGRLAGLGDHTETTMGLMRSLFVLPIAVIVVVLLLGCLRGKVDPVTGTGLGLGAVVLLGPVVHPWYLFWALLPLVVTRAMPFYRRGLLLLSVVLALAVPPTGADFFFRGFQLPLAITAGAAMYTLALYVVARLIRSPGGDTGDTGDTVSPGATRAPSDPEPAR